MKTLAAVALLGCALHAAAGTGALDPTFGQMGVVGVPGISLAVQPDAKIVALGREGHRVSTAEIGQFSLARLTSSGAIDFSRTDDVASCTICGGVAGTYAALLQPDARIVSVGTFLSVGQGCNRPSYIAVRHLGSGDLDATFGTSGVYRLQVGRAHAVALQADGKLVLAGTRGSECTPFGGLPVTSVGLVRVNADGTLDTTFGTNGTVETALGSGTISAANAIAVLADGRIAVAGHASNGANTDFAIAVYGANGALEANALHDATPGANDSANALAVLSDGKILVAGASGADGVLLRLTSLQALDTTFGTAGKVTLPRAPIEALALQPDGKIVVATRDGDVFRLLADGSRDASFGVAGRVSTGLAEVRSVAVQADSRIVVGANANTARIDPALPAAITPDVASIDFLEQPLRTTSAARTVQLTNDSAASQAITSITATAGFVATSDCGTLAPGAQCTASVAFRPETVGAITGDLVVSWNGGTVKTFLAGKGEISLSTHYYRTILRREADAAGKAFWDAEAARMQALGASVNEAWYAMAQLFFSSPEYLGFARDDTGFVTDLYNAFFSRAPDGPGLAYWVSQLEQGMPREVLLAGFMFSPEFIDFTRNLFGATAVRAEVDMVMDFYRGLLARLPEAEGFAAWLDVFRLAQCQNADAVRYEANAISKAFIESGEHAARNRSNAQYVGDLYNAFLRRGGDLDGVRFWIEQLDSNVRSRESLRQSFVGSPEFQARVQAVVNQGCMS
jgi:uncharacterized delta-60 repeat protein